MISTRVKFELAASTLMKSNRITAEEQDKDKLGKLCSERKACRQKWLATLCLSGRLMYITWCLCSRNNWDRVILYRYLAKWFCHHNTGVQMAVNTYLERYIISSVASCLIYYTSKAILKTQGMIYIQVQLIFWLFT